MIIDNNNYFYVTFSNLANTYQLKAFFPQNFQMAFVFYVACIVASIASVDYAFTLNSVKSSHDLALSGRLLEANFLILCPVIVFWKMCYSHRVCTHCVPFRLSWEHFVQLWPRTVCRQSCKAYFLGLKWNFLSQK